MAENSNRPAFVDPFESGKSKPAFVDPFDPQESFAPEPPREQKYVAPQDRTEPDFGAVGGSAVSGSVFGAFTPEITKYTGTGLKTAGQVLGASPWPIGQRLSGAMQRGGETLEKFGTQMKAAPITRGRISPMIGGAISGATSETAGQASEILGYPGLTAEAARLAGGFAPPIIGGLLKFAGQKTVGRIFDAVDALNAGKGELAKEATEAERKAIKEKFDQLSKTTGTPNEGRAAEELFKDLETAITSIENRAASRTSALQRGIPRIQANVEARRKAAESGLSSVGDATRTASDTGESLRKSIVSEQSALKIMQSDEYKAQQALRDAEVQKKQNAGDYVENTSAFKKLEKYLHDKLMLVVTETPMRQTTDPGVRSAYERLLGAIKTLREPITAEEATIASQKGFKVSSFVDKEGQVQHVREYPTAFDALDDVRRKLGKAAFGEPAEGYEALEQNIAKKLYGDISDIQSQFAGKAHDVLQGTYETYARLLDKFKGKAGKGYTGIDFDDPIRFKKSPDQLVKEAFRSKQGVDDALRLTAGDVTEVRKLAGDYVASQLGQAKTAEAAEKWLSTAGKDFLSHPQLAELRRKTEAYIYNLKSAQAAEKQGKALVSGAEGRIQKVSQETKQIVDAIRGNQFPVARIKSLITGGKPSEWKLIGPIIAQNPLSKADLMIAVRETVAEAASKSPKAAVQTFKDDIAPALQSVGIPQASIDGLGRQLDEIVKFAYEPAKLDMISNLILKATRAYAATLPPRIGSLVAGQAQEK